MLPRGRRRSKALLPFATVSGSAPVFDPDWPAIETAYGHGFNEEVRREIVATIKRYLDMRRFEEEALPLDDVVKWASRVQREAKALYETLIAARGKDGHER